MSLPYEDLNAQTEKLAAAMRRRLDIRGSDPWKVLEKGRVHLTSRMQSELDYMFEAQKMASHPKLALQIDMPRIEHTVQKISEQVRRIDIPRRKRLRNYGIATSIVVNLALVAAVAVGIAVWRGVL